MTNIENDKKVEASQLITIENKRAFKANAVNEMLIALDNRIVCKTKRGNIELLGKDLRVSSLDLEKGTLEVSGELESFKYLAEVTTKGFFKRIFK